MAGTPMTDSSSSQNPPPPPPFGSPTPRALRRRPDEGHLGGVCAGLAHYFNVDPILVRIAAVVLALSGPGVVAYVIAWIFIPEERGQTDPWTQHLHGSGQKDRGTQVLGIVLLALALSVLWGDWWSPARHWLFPLALIGLGSWLLLRSDAPDEPSGPPAPPAPPVPPARPSDTAGYGESTPASTAVTLYGADADQTVTDATLVDARADDATADDATPEHETAADAGGGDAGQPPPWHAASEPPATPAPERGRRHRRLLGPVVAGALLVWSGLAWLLGIRLETGLAVGLCIVGLGFVFGAFVGGSWILVVPAVAIAAALVAASTFDIPLEGPVGNRTWAPSTISEVEDEYRLSMGEGRLDLSDVDLDGDDLKVEASVGMGHLLVTVPEGVELVITGESSAGEVMLFGTSDTGLNVSTHRIFDRGADGGRLQLELEVGFGKVEVIQAGVPAIPVLG